MITIGGALYFISTLPNIVSLSAIIFKSEGTTGNLLDYLQVILTAAIASITLGYFLFAKVFNLGSDKN